MASKEVTHSGTDVAQATESSTTFDNPGIPPHTPRLSDLDKKAEKRAERQVVALFLVSIIGTVVAIAAYLMFDISGNDFTSLRWQTTLVGLGMAFSLLGIGLGAVHWAKTLMPDHEVAELRHEQRGTDEDRKAAGDMLMEGIDESGITRRPVVVGAAAGAVGLFALPGVIMLGGLGPVMGPNKIRETFHHTAWKKGVRLVRDPQGSPVKAADVSFGEVFQIMPDGIYGTEHYLEEKAKSAVLLIRVEPGVVEEDAKREGWDVDGIYAYSKICTHVGCPVALYEQQTHHLLCPCHQSTFDVTKHCKVIFGPAKRPLPQLPIEIDDEGYLVASGGFSDTPGPSFWERND